MKTISLLDFRGNKRSFVNIIGVIIKDIGKRNTKKYSFKNPDLLDLRKLGSMVSSPEDFKRYYGRLLSILKTKVEDEILDTLVQFHDPLYHCFMFPDYHLIPTLEENSYWAGLLVTGNIPFSCLENVPESPGIAEALHLKIFDVEDNLTFKGGFLGLTYKFLMGKPMSYLNQIVEMLLKSFSPYSFMVL